MKNFGTLLFGGAFDPPTMAHVLNVKYLADTLDFENLIVFPTGKPSHKEIECLDNESRLKVVREVFEEIEGVTVSDLEFKMSGESYTYRTLDEFRKSYSHLHLVLGMDSYLSLPRWKNVDHIISLANIVVLRRGGYEFKEHDLFQANPEKFTFIDNPLFEMSSSFVRERIKAGKDIRFYVTDKAYHLLNEMEDLCKCTQEKKL